MITPSLPTLLSISFVLGILHAFDADHIMAVSALASRRAHWSSSMVYAFKWALGHGGILLLATLAVIGLGMHLPEAVSHWAEKAVGVILIVAGLSMLWTLHRQRIGLHVHLHGALTHAHMVAAPANVRHDHTPVFVGLVHGLAGSAPALALIPAALNKPAMALLYLGLFSLGVLAGMLIFGVALGQFQRILTTRSALLFDTCRAVLGICATALGVAWLGFSA